MNEQAPRKQMSGCAKAGIGCGIALVILLIISAIGAWWVAKNARGWGASLAATAINSAVDQSTLPDSQKQAIKSRVDHVKDEFTAGNITLEQLNNAMQKLDVQNLISAGFAQYVGTAMIDQSQLSDDDKAVGKQALNRVSQGVIDGNISTSQLQTLLAPVMQTDPSGNKKIKSNPTEQELQQVVDNAIALADQAGVPQDAPEVDFAEQVGRAFDEAFAAP